MPLAAAGIGVALGPRVEEIARGLETARPAKGRCVWRRAGALSILDDTYNANPVSVRAALETLAASAGERRRVVVLGDMLELGPITDAAHREMGGGGGRLGSGGVHRSRARVPARRGGGARGGARGEPSRGDLRGHRGASSSSGSFPATPCWSRARAACAWSAWSTRCWPASEERMPDALRPPRAAGERQHRLQRLPVHHVPGGHGHGDGHRDLVPARPVDDRAAARAAVRRRDDTRGHARSVIAPRRARPPWAASSS